MPAPWSRIPLARRPRRRWVAVLLALLVALALAWWLATVATWL